MCKLKNCKFTVFPHIVSSAQQGNYSSFYYIRKNLMRKLFEIFKILHFPKRIVATATTWGNTVPKFLPDLGNHVQLCDGNFDFLHFFQLAKRQQTRGYVLHGICKGADYHFWIYTYGGQNPPKFNAVISLVEKKNVKGQNFHPLAKDGSLEIRQKLKWPLWQPVNNAGTPSITQFCYTAVFYVKWFYITQKPC